MTAKFIKKTGKLFLVGGYCFMAHPCGGNGHWARTDRCVAFIDCGYCKAPAGQMCISNSTGNSVVYTHTARREAYRRTKPRTDDPRGRVVSQYVTIEEVG